MKEHEDDSMLSVDDIVTKTQGILADRDEGEDMMVDVVGADDDNHGTTGVNLVSKAGSDWLVNKCSRKETDMEQVAGSVGIRVFNSEKDEAVVNEEGLKSSVEGDIITTVASESNGDITVIDTMEVTERGLTEEVLEMHVETVEEAAVLDTSKITESRANLDSEEVDMVVVDEGFASKDEAEDSVTVNNPTSSTEVVNGGEVGENSKDESMDPTSKVITDDAQEVTDGDGVLNEKNGKQNEGLDSSVSEPSNAITPGSEDVDVVVVDEGLANKDNVHVDPSLVCPDNRSLATEVGSSATGEGDKLNEKEIFHSTIDIDVVVVEEGVASKDEARDVVSLDPTIEVTINDSEKAENGTGAVDTKLALESSSGEPQFGGETAVIDKEETKRGLNKVEEIVEQPTESVQEVASGDAMDVKTEKEDEVLDSSNVPESLTTVNLSPEEVLTKKNEAQDSDSADPRLVFPDNQSVSTEFVKLPESLNDHIIFATVNRVIETNAEGQNCKVKLPITNDMSRPVEEQGLKVEAVNTGSIIDATVCVKPSNDGDEIPTGHIKISNSNVAVPSTIEMNGFQVSADVFEEIDDVTPIEDVAKDSEYSYEDAHMEGGDDEGTDIDEVLGWKDDEIDQHYATSEAADVEQRLLESSCEPVLIGHQEENFKFREPIVYGRRAHVEVPVYDSLDGSGSPLLEDENIEIETDSDEEDYDESVQEHEHQLTEPSVPGSSFSLHQSRYFQPPEHEGEFSVSDLVWSKIRSHPWWPGQIIDPSNASNKAMKYHKKDCFLVAYFGDGTFAWNDSTVLKPFRANFSQIEKHTNLEAFKNAVECAMEEVTRRVELGLACSCVSKDVYKKIEYQVIENGGVRKKYSTRHGKDESCSSSSFEPDKLVDYVRLLAQFPGEGDKMELAMAKAQLSSYCRFKGYRELPEFRFYGDLLEDAEKLDKNVEKFENNLIENAYPNKEISLSDLTDDAPESGYGDIITSKSVSSSGYKKRKARDSISNGSMKRPKRQPGKVSTPPISIPKPSFKIGALIQRVASQLTGPTPLKSNSENGQHVDQVLGSPVSLQTPENLQKEASVAEMLYQLHLTAQDPMKRYGFLQTVIPFFYDRRAAVFSKSLKKNYPTIEKPVSGRKRKASNENDPEEFEFDFDEINDSYWTDRIIQNHSEDQLQQDHQNGGIDYQQVVAYEQDKPAKRGRKKRVFSTDHKVEVKVESEVDKRRRENLATEVVLKFAEGIYFPPEIQLNKMFRRFGSLMESETEVDRQGGRARVVFKKCSDAEVAHSSAGKINIFGSIDVNYELNYTPLVSYKPLPLLLLQNSMDAV